MTDSVPADDLPDALPALKPTIGKARLLRGAVPFKDAGIPNLGDTYRAQIATDSGVKHAIVKDVPQRELANEMMAAALAVELDLPVPAAFIVVAESDVLATRFAPKAGNVSYLFGSADLKSPSVAQIVNTKLGPDMSVLRTVIDTLISSGRLGGLYGFDAWAANTDRHLGNLLIQSNALPWLIDHGRCFTGQNWVPADLLADQIFLSRLKFWLTPQLSPEQKGAYAKEAAGLADKIVKMDVHATGTKNDIPGLYGDTDFNALVTFLHDRAAHTPRIAADSLDLVI